MPQFLGKDIELSDVENAEEFMTQDQTQITFEQQEDPVNMTSYAFSSSAIFAR